MVPLALIQVFFKQIKIRTGCDKVTLESGDEFICITLFKLSGDDAQQLKKVFRWNAVNQLTIHNVVEEFNTLYPPAPDHQSTGD